MICVANSIVAASSSRSQGTSGPGVELHVNGIVMPENIVDKITATIEGQLFGLPISRVQDVFVPDRLTRVHLLRTESAGLLDVRAASSR